MYQTVGLMHVRSDIELLQNYTTKIMYVTATPFCRDVSTST